NEGGGYAQKEAPEEYGKQHQERRDCEGGAQQRLEARSNQEHPLQPRAKAPRRSYRSRSLSTPIARSSSSSRDDKSPSGGSLGSGQLSGGQFMAAEDQHEARARQVSAPNGAQDAAHTRAKNTRASARP